MRTHSTNVSRIYCTHVSFSIRRNDFLKTKLLLQTHDAVNLEPRPSLRWTGVWKNIFYVWIEAFRRYSNRIKSSLRRACGKHAKIRDPPPLLSRPQIKLNLLTFLVLSGKLHFAEINARIAVRCSIAMRCHTIGRTIYEIVGLRSESTTKPGILKLAFL